ncbi:hypothetical protein BAUCODRAFT_145129 [Baudoinia panamericana UAMH 10762]|uniref:Uncharacterized protein n=1 Tax=Baudoinia panamericana (strain UAMH 10762) TaxID=717646 RepID=M2N6N5_BAUPA|nr:uncharacterized protein BAUCODRAFT_145129 [Baudoinia panamericana UAMH 10762]EMC99748.1 hypothetical protein BAUCODRAFT_145129 [Baudoinia panamericana UAMH 10762]
MWSVLVSNKQATKRKIDDVGEEDVSCKKAALEVERVETNRIKEAFETWQLTHQRALKADRQYAVDLQLASNLNSSGQHPELAREHNTKARVYGKPRLLALPGIARSNIIRHSVVKKTGILIAANDPESDAEPCLMSLCQQLRTEASPIYYRENNFVIYIRNYDIDSLLPWLKRADSFRDGDGTRFHVNGAMELVGGYTRCNGIITIHTDGQPHWANLVEWLRLAHAGEVIPLCDNCEATGSQIEQVKGAFDHVMQATASWETVAEGLKGVRRILGATNQGWWVDHTSSTPTDIQSGFDVEEEIRPGLPVATQTSFVTAQEPTRIMPDHGLGDVEYESPGLSVSEMADDFDFVDHANGIY